MARALRPCATPGCPELVSKGTRHCPSCAAAAERKRGTPAQRGYDKAHWRLRNKWVPKVRTGRVPCARCGLLIGPLETWALDHTDDRTGYLGPSHTRCNNSAGGKASQGR